jgi:peptidoglycan/xylan/chitin deacetylase (PgdA/CDA1 family)
LLTERSKFAQAAVVSAPGPEPLCGGPHWPPPETLADPPIGSRLSTLAAQMLFLSGAVRLAEGIARRIEFRRAPGGFVALPRRVIRPRFAILCYHRIGRGGVPIYSGVRTSRFEEQMKYLHEHYRVLSLGEMLREMAEPWVNPPAVAVTFDDGYADLYTEAFPILRRYEIPATIYLTIGAIESGEVAWYDRVFVAFQVAPAMDFTLPLNPPRYVRLGTPQERLLAAVEFISLMKKLPARDRRAACEGLESTVALPASGLANRMLTWEQIRTMQAAGVSFGTHTMTHPVVSRLNDGELLWELGESKRLLEERLQRRVLDFAFPFGKAEECGESALDCLGGLGYRSAVTTESGLNYPGIAPFALRRVSFGEESSLCLFALQLSRLFLFPQTHSATSGAPAVPSKTGSAGSRHVSSDPGVRRHA